MNQAFGEKLMMTFGLGNPNITLTHKPEIISSKDAVKYLVGKKNICILTGAGLSAASGIPTFRGQNGFWTKSYGDEVDPQVILTEKFFCKNPQLNWKWHYDFYELRNKCKPNAGHHSILKFQEYCHQSKKAESFLVTQNIDDYHPKLIKQSQILMNGQEERKQGTKDFAFTPYVYEVHGNVDYMHCSEEDKDCSKLFYQAPDLKQVEDIENHVPICKECGANMKPHCMFFDESYSEQYYRSDSVDNFVENKMDCLIVVGTALATGLARRIVNKAIDKIECPVIEVNLETSIDRGFNLQILEKSETALDNMFNEYYRLSKLPTGLKNNTQKPQIKTNNQNSIAGRAGNVSAQPKQQPKKEEIKSQKPALNKPAISQQKTQVTQQKVVSSIKSVQKQPAKR
eukprot:403357388